MHVLPAIDLKNGRCVRLTQGRADQETVYSEDPVAMARSFAAAGAGMLHLVDLDGAFRGRTANGAVIRAIREALRIPIEVGGGLRSEADIADMLALEVDSVIVGTLAVRDPPALERALRRFGGERIQLGIDARGGKVAVHGWAEDTLLDAVAFARNWSAKGIRRVIFTDIERDGMLAGPNLEAIRNFARGAPVQVTASGGVSRLEDFRALQTLEPEGVDRVIVGKALYEGTLRLEDLLRLEREA